jgi:hypothetical protein
MQGEEDYAHDDSDVSKSSGYVKREKSKKPKNNQNCGDKLKHIFIAVLPSGRSSPIPFSHIFLSPCVSGKTTFTQQSERGAGARVMALWKTLLWRNALC